MPLDQFFENINLEKTNQHPGTYFEQKTTPDLLWAVAQVILDVTKNDRNLIFKDQDIRSSSLFNSLMSEYFSKPEQREDTENEYNKVSSYQLGLLTFAGILEEIDSRPKKFKIKELEILKILAVNDLSALKFLSKYVEKFIFDNNLNETFERYKSSSNQENYNLAKDAFWDWARTHTRVRGDDRRHTYRVFNKIFNIYAHTNRVSGEYKARIVRGVCPYSFLVYNRSNFRDEEKPTDISRQNYAKQLQKQIDTEGVIHTLVAKAKQAITLRHPLSEVRGENLGYEENAGIHIHHILPESAYPQFSFFRENLISLTPGQHLSRAHPQGNTHRVNPEFQLVCLIAKISDIDTSIQRGDGFYRISNFIQMVDAKFNLNLPENTPADQIKTKLESFIDH